MTKFDGNQAWNEAMRLVSANREVLLVMAGVFIFLPAVAAQFFMGDSQAQMMALLPKMQNTKDPMAAMQPLMALYAKVLPYVLVMMVAQTIGKLAMMALLTDYRRPTVGEALAIGLKSLPTLIVVGLLLMLGYAVVAFALALVIGVLVAVLGMISPVLSGLMAVVAVAAFIGALLVVFTRLSLVTPVVIIERISSPVQAIKLSWNMVKGNTRRLLLFFMLLGVAYMVIALIAGGVLGVVVGLIVGKGSAMALGTGIVGGLIGMAASVVFTALLVAIHRQLAGESAQSLAETFS